MPPAASWKTTKKAIHGKSRVWSTLLPAPAPLLITCPGVKSRTRTFPVPLPLFRGKRPSGRTSLSTRFPRPIGLPGCMSGACPGGGGAEACKQLGGARGPLSADFSEKKRRIRRDGNPGKNRPGRNRPNPEKTAANKGKGIRANRPQKASGGIPEKNTSRDPAAETGEHGINLKNSGIIGTRGRAGKSLAAAASPGRRAPAHNTRAGSRSAAGGKTGRREGYFVINLQ